MVITGSTASFINGSAARLSGTIQSQGLPIAPPGEWTIFSAPAVNTQATVTKAAGGGTVRHILRSFACTLTNNAAAASLVSFAIRDGASGVGTLLYNGNIAIPAVIDSYASFILPDINIIGSPNTGMTIEFTSAGGNNTFESISGTGYSTQ